VEGGVSPGAVQRVQAGLFPTVQAGMAAALRSEGVRGLFRGYKAQVLRDVTYHAVQVSYIDINGRDLKKGRDL
jgi:hypothetical protein